MGTVIMTRDTFHRNKNKMFKRFWGSLAPFMFAFMGTAWPLNGFAPSMTPTPFDETTEHFRQFSQSLEGFYGDTGNLVRLLMSPYANGIGASGSVIAQAVHQDQADDELTTELGGEAGAWAHLRLGSRAQKGAGTPQNLQTAREHYHCALQFGDQPGQYAKIALAGLDLLAPYGEQASSCQQEEIEALTYCEGEIGFWANVMRMLYYQVGLGGAQNVFRAQGYRDKLTQYPGELGELQTYVLAVENALTFLASGEPQKRDCAQTNCQKLIDNGQIFKIAGHSLMAALAFTTREFEMVKTHYEAILSENQPFEPDPLQNCLLLDDLMLSKHAFLELQTHASCLLGALHQFGLGTERNTELAKACYQQSMALGGGNERFGHLSSWTAVLNGSQNRTKK